MAACHAHHVRDDDQCQGEGGQGTQINLIPELCVRTDVGQRREHFVE